MARDWHSVALYGGAIQEARASGDLEAMETVAQRAEREAAGDPEIQKALAELRAEIARLRGQGHKEPVIRPLYGVAIQEAIASGDLQQMRQVQARARTEGANDAEIQSALQQLDAEIGRLGGGGGDSEGGNGGSYPGSRGGSGGGPGGGSGGGYGGDGGTVRTLYGPAIQEARASGDLQQMRDVARRAETEGGGDPEVQSALGDLRAEISRLESSGG